MRIKKEYYVWATYLLLGMGMVTRIAIFLQNRSFFLDEANLARNVVEKSPDAFFKVLDYEQYAPPLFLLIQKFNVLWFGATEYGVRFFPLVAGLISLVLFYKVSSRFLKPGIALLLTTFIFSFAEYYLHFGTEGKQYASDIMFTLLLIELALNQKGVFGWGAFFKWTMIGVVVSWFSMPSVFVLAGVGVYFFLKPLPKWDKPDLYRLLLSIGLWVVSFGVYYFSILKTDVESDYLQNYHEDYFLPLFPSSLPELKKFGTILLSLIKTSVGHTALALVLGIVGFGTGFYELWAKYKKEGLLLIIPVLATLLASALHQYSLIPRLTLFFIPLLLIIIGIGIQWFFNFEKIWIKGITLLLVVLTAAVHDGVKYTWQRYEIEEIRQVLDYIEKEQKEADLIYVNHSANPAVHFYTQLHKNKEKYHFNTIVKGDWRLRPDISLFKVEGKPVNRVWVVYSHLISESSSKEKAKEMNFLFQNFQMVKEVNYKGAAAVLIERH